MVFLGRIYTKGGDKGDTSLGSGERVPKHSPRVSAYGDVDELNSVLGLLHLQVEDEKLKGFVRRVQNDLFDLGADLCVPEDENAAGALRITSGQVEALEKVIDHYNEQLAPLNSFVLRGGTPAAAWCHLACTVCRRAERAATALAVQEAVNPFVIMYLNRLSDCLFVLARHFNHNGEADVLWQPGQGQGGG